MNRLWQNWWKLALSAGEIALTAPQVMQQRANRLLSAPGLGSARNRREAARMVSGKVGRWRRWPACALAKRIAAAAAVAE